MKKERLFYLDFVRAIAVISIVITHFNARYLYLTPPAPEKAIITTMISNVYIGNWGVSLFFIISGAALMYTYGTGCDLKRFYKKRFLSIYPMFWMAYIAVFLYDFYINKSVPMAGIPKYRFVFSALGLDGLLITNGFQTFYLIGEWFLGVIILTYLIFPLLRKFINEKPHLIMAVTFLLYILGLLFCYYGKYGIVSATLIFVRMPELIFGMLFVKYNCKINWKIAIGSLAVLCINYFVNPPLVGDIQTTYVGILSFLVMVYVSYFVKNIFIKDFCAILSKYSYAIFLVHHIIIAQMMSTFDLGSISVLHSYILFACVCVVIAIFAWVLYRLHETIMRYIERCCNEIRIDVK